MKKLGIDLGNSSIKAVGGDKDDLIFRTVLSLAAEDSEDTLHVVEMNGRKLHFGVGEPLIETVKTRRRHIAETILLMAYEVYGAGTHEIELGLTLPITLYKLTKDTFKSNIEQMGALQGHVNGKEVSAKLNNVQVNAEGLTAFYALQPEIEKKPTLFLDMGHGTIDGLILDVDTETRKWKLIDTFQLNRGGKLLLEDLSRTMFDYLGELLTVQQLEQILAAGGRIGDIDLSRHFAEACTATADSITREIKLLCNDMQYRQIVTVGGAALIYNDVAGLNNIKEIKDRNKLLYSNAVGSYLKLK